MNTQRHESAAPPLTPAEWEGSNSPSPGSVKTIFADPLAYRLQAILRDLDAWYGYTRTHRGTESRIDRVAEGLHDLLAEVSE